MEIEVKDKEKRVNIWLTKAECQDVNLKAGLKPLFQEYKKKGYLVAVFESGTEDLEGLVRDLLLFNRIRLRELDKL